MAAKGRHLTPTMTACLLHLASDQHRGRGIPLDRGFATAAVHLRMRALVGGGDGCWWATKLGIVVADKIERECQGTRQGDFEYPQAPDRLSSGSGEIRAHGPRGDEEN
jgi:hypothetical protein